MCYTITEIPPVTQFLSVTAEYRILVKQRDNDGIVLNLAICVLPEPKLYGTRATIILESQILTRLPETHSYGPLETMAINLKVTQTFSQYMPYNRRFSRKDKNNENFKS